MKKSSFEGFITRYNLGGEVESVKIDSTEEGLSVKFISDDKTLLGNVSSDNKDFPSGEFGVYTTSQLKGLLTVLDSDIDVKEGDASLVFSDKGTSVNYMLADLSVIPVVPDLKQLPEFTSTIKMDNDFVNKFVKSKGALSDSDTFTFSCKSSVICIICHSIVTICFFFFFFRSIDGGRRQIATIFFTPNWSFLRLF